ncbi:hypothetical protein QS257_06515 [Terrilactibacillus sp. S3-3]|nr:hypothetical protein QS257_06515 [Terrilactibacillus sp. S3-3]
MLAALCKSPINTFDEVVKSLMRAENDASNRLWQEIEKFGDPNAFWRLAEKVYGYTGDEKSLKDLIIFFGIDILVRNDAGYPNAGGLAALSFHTANECCGSDEPVYESAGRSAGFPRHRRSDRGGRPCTGSP